MSEDQHDCRTLLSSISDYIDGELDPELCQALERHLAQCNNCQIVVNTLRKTIELYHGSPTCDPLPGDVRERLFIRLHLDEYLRK